MQIKPIKTRIFIENEDLLKFIREHLPSVEDGDVLVVTSKIVALGQGRTHSDVSFKKQLARLEAEKTIETKYGTLALFNGRWCVNAGIDESNAAGKLILLPADIENVTMKLRHQLQEVYRVKNLGLIITDSRSIPLRDGVMSSCLASAGIAQLRSYLAHADLDGREMRHTELNVVDSLSAAAGLEMGEGSERTPLCLIKAAPIEFTDSPTPASNLCILPEEDLYRDIFKFRLFKNFDFRAKLQKLWNPRKRA